MVKEDFPISEQEIEATERLRPVWNATVEGLGGNIEQAEKEFQNIIKKYKEGDARAYHNILHIDRMISLILRISHLAKNPHELTVAAFGHDIVYVAGSPTNEAESAKITNEMLERLEVKPEPRAEVSRLIMITKDHKPDADDTDGKILTDGDYEILGSPRSVYGWYSSGIYNENVLSGRVTVDNYKIGRGGYLEGWKKQLEEGTLFYTPEIRDALHAQAYENITSEIEQLKSL